MIAAFLGIFGITLKRVHTRIDRIEERQDANTSRVEKKIDHIADRIDKLIDRK